MSVGSLNWTIFCAESNEYGVDKAAWAESVCKAIGSSSYNAYAEAPTWLQMLGSGVFTMRLDSYYSLSYRIFIRFSPRGNSYITQQTSRIYRQLLR